MARRKYLRQDQVFHILRAAASITDRRLFVVIGTSAAIASLKRMPLAMMATREADIYVPDADDQEELSDLLDATIGEGSGFDRMFGYYGHGVDRTTAMLPADWRDRAISVDVIGAEAVVCLCPEINDLALSKLCAWREKDRTWLAAGLRHGILRLETMRARVCSIEHPASPAIDELRRRLDALPIA